jgi:uncharacterized protein with PIN domain
MKFLCDQMLGDLSRWLRFFGFDTYYIKKDIDDVQLLNIAEEENRIILTRDKELIIRAKKRNLKNIKIDNIDLDNQLKLVLKNIKINSDKILSRCSICNNILKKICKENIKDRVPNKIYNTMFDFFICNNCDKIYWMGSHYDKIINRINEIKKED